MSNKNQVSQLTIRLWSQVINNSMQLLESLLLSSNDLAATLMWSNHFFMTYDPMHHCRIMYSPKAHKVLTYQSMGGIIYLFAELELSIQEHRRLDDLPGGSRRPFGSSISTRNTRKSIKVKSWMSDGIPFHFELNSV